MKIKQLIRSKVLVEISEAVTQTASGIFLPGEAIKKPLEGKVIMAGSDVQSVKVGDTVRYYDHCGIPMEYEGKNCIFLKEKTEIELVL
jgi:chaperonin GroES